MTTLAGSAVTIEISTNLTTPSWKVLVCREDVTVTLGGDINRRNTACGQVIGLGPTTFAASGTAVAETAPTSGQISMEDIIALKVNRTPVLVQVWDNGTGAALYVSSSAYFGDLSIGVPVDNAVDFDFSLEGYGAVDITP